jgi:hypothetical protein
MVDLALFLALTVYWNFPALKAHLVEFVVMSFLFLYALCFDKECWRISRLTKDDKGKIK